MNTKTVYQVGQDGLYLGPTLADESPLEPGVFLIPAGCVEVEPPGTGYNEIQRWTGKEWVVETIPPEVEEPENQVQPEDAERMWRHLELVRADNEIRKHEDGDSKIIATEKEWRTYRVSLRDWPQSELFPDIEHRPSAPA